MKHEQPPSADEVLTLDENSKEAVKQHVIKLDFSSGIYGHTTETVIAQLPSLAPDVLDKIKARITELFSQNVKVVNKGETVVDYENLVKRALGEFGAEIIETPKLDIFYERGGRDSELGAS